MSYMGLFWETGMPEAWALSRKSEERIQTDAARQAWPQDCVDLGTLLNPANAAPGDNAGRPVPEPDNGKQKADNS